MPDARFAMNYATVRRKWDAVEFIEGCARYGITNVSLWADEVVEAGPGRIKTLLDMHNMSVTGLNRVGPYISSDPETQDRAIAKGVQIITLAADLGAGCVFVFPGGLVPGSKNLQEAEKRTIDGIAALMPYALDVEVPLAIEPLHPMVTANRSCINTIKQANDLCTQFGDGIGVVVDVYNVWWDGTLKAEIRRAGRDQLLGFHLSDWLVETKSLLNDRGMIGDGVIDLTAIDLWMNDAGYSGAREVELFSDRWWAEDPDLVLQTAVNRYEQIFGCNG